MADNESKDEVWEDEWPHLIIWFFLILATMTLPWAFYSARLTHDGFALRPEKAANFAINHPQTVDVVVNLLATVFTLWVGYLFTKSATIFARKWLASRRQTDLFGITFMSAIANRNLAWCSTSLRHVIKSCRWKRSLMVAAVTSAVAVFTLIPSGFTALLHPYPFA